MGTVTLTSQQQRRIQITERLVQGTLSLQQAATLLALTTRQMQRVRSAYKTKGMEASVHGNTGRSPLNRTSTAMEEKIAALLEALPALKNFNASHLHEVLVRDHDLTIGRSTLDRLLVTLGIHERKKKKSVQRRSRRERVSAAGQMLQVDASQHDWLQGRGAKMSLLGAIDDATSVVVYLHFRPTEDQAGYLRMLREVVREYGVPASIYHDKHTILRSPKQATLDDELANRAPMSQVQRVMHELGIEAIAAHSPQAKGRIERLWGTLQNRLINEMALANVCSLEEANSFLTDFMLRHNQRFEIEPVNTESCWVKPVVPLDTDYQFSAKEKRRVNNDNTVSWNNKTLQLKPDPTLPILQGREVSVHTNVEQQVLVYFDKIMVPHKEIPPAVKKRQTSRQLPLTEASATPILPSVLAKQQAEESK